MPIKGSNKTEYQREYMKRKRVTKQGISQGLTNYPHILNWLVDPVMRPKLERICESLGKAHQLDNVFIGTNHPIDCYTLNELLEATVAVK